jgi:Tat-targeted selenate reductase subunit YnfE/Tat-targeted selenate reductase subunit YnfF
MADIAALFDKRHEFTEGRTQDEWIEQLYERGANVDPSLPSWEQMLEHGIYKRQLESCIGLRDFRRDPEKNPLGTPSGKIEIYSEQLAELATTWELAEDESINPLPVFTPGLYGFGSVSEEFPLYACGYHHKSRTHSCFGAIDILQQAARNQIWINPVDATPRDIETGDKVLVTSPHGIIQVEARVTLRVIPGAIAIPQGAWHNANMYGDQVDKGGCVNTLTAYRPTALGKGNGPAHSMIVQVTKV